MEEVDNIIIVTLRQIGCDVPDEVQSLGEFSTELIVEGVVRCLRTINEDIDLPLRLPESMSVRFRVGTALAEACKEMGYGGEIGYQTFLYSNVEGVRRLFMYLVERLPREGATTADDSPAGSSALFNRAMAAELARQLHGLWTPPFCKQQGIARASPDTFHWEGARGTHHFNACPVHAAHGLADLAVKVSKATRRYYSDQLRWITAQPQPAFRVVASLQEWNIDEVTEAHEWEAEWSSNGLRSGLSQQEYRQQKKDKLRKKLGDTLRSSVQQSTSTASRFGDLGELVASFAAKSGHQQSKGTRFTHAKDLQFTQVEETSQDVLQSDTAEDLMQKREDEVNSLHARLEELTGQLESMEMDIKKFTANLGRLTELTKGQQSENAQNEEEYKVTKQVMELLPNAEENIEKLQEVIASTAQQLVKLAEQWEQRRAPLINQYRELKHLNANKLTETQKMLAEINKMRAEMKELASDGRAKEEHHKQLLSEYEQMTKDLNRGAYTRRILEIVNNIRKQKTEIGKVLTDTRALQKEINLMCGQLDRTFTVTDELIFKDAKRDETCRSAYKLLANLHENCAVIVKTVEETGTTMREIRDLEDQLEKENKKKTASSLEQITADYEQMQKDNQTLRAKLKGKA